MPVLRTLICTLDTLRIERALQLPSFIIQGGTSDGPTALRLIVKEHPHLVILQNELIGLDGLTILKKLGEALLTGFPYIILTTGISSPFFMHQAKSLGADACIPMPFSTVELLHAINVSCSLTPPALSFAGRTQREKIICDLLDGLKLPHKLKGRQYIARGVDLFVSSGTMRSDFDNSLYPTIGTQFGTTRQAVEKSIRTAIESTWLSGDLETIQRLFGLSVDAERGKPTNSECISMLAEHTARALLSNVMKARKENASAAAQ